MPGFGGILSIATGALSTSQSAVQVASHNIANANTKGYSRQREVLANKPPEVTPLGVFGTGVTMVSVQRQRDVLLDQEYRLSNGLAGGNSLRSELLQRVETIFGEPSDNGLASALDRFYGAWSELASDPTSTSARTAVQQSGGTLARTFNSFSSQLQNLTEESVTRAQGLVTNVNRLTNSIAELNGQIVTMESAGDTASDLRDQRDNLIDEMSKIVNVRVIDRPDGATQVLFGTLSVVDGMDSKQLEMTNTSSLQYQIVGSTNTVRNIGGHLGALQDVHNTDIAAVQSDLNALAAAIVTDVNALHKAGWSPTSAITDGNWNPLNGPTGSQVNFFDPAKTSASSISLSATVAADARSIAAGSAWNETGNNDVALSLAGLRDLAPSSTSETNFGNDYREIVGSVAGQLSGAKSSSTVYETMTDQADQRRVAVFGVSVDEELIQIMKQQQAYAAASKIIKTVDEMMQTLLSLK